MHWRIIYTDFYRPCPGIHGILDRTVDSYSWFHVLNTNFQYGLLSLLKAFIDIISFIQDESTYIWPIYLTYIWPNLWNSLKYITKSYISSGPLFLSEWAWKTSQVRKIFESVQTWAVGMCRQISEYNLMKDFWSFSVIWKLHRFQKSKFTLC